MDFDYKKYSLEQLENWMHDAMSAGEASAEEIYNTIKKVVQEQYYSHKHYASQAYELLALLNGNGIDYVELYNNEKPKPYDEMIASGYEMTDDGFWIKEDNKKDKVYKWVLPVQVDDAAGDAEPIYYINLPDDLLEAANLKEGDQVEWIDLNNGSFEMRKVNGAE